MDIAEARYLLSVNPYHDWPPFSDLGTSANAARLVRHGTMRQRERILRTLAEEPRTNDELEVALGMLAQSCSARRRELFLVGLVDYTGYRRPTRHKAGGRNVSADVIEPTPLGFEVVTALVEDEEARDEAMR